MTPTSKFKPGQLVMWEYGGIPQFLAIVVIVGIRETPSGSILNGIHYLRILALTEHVTGIGSIGWTRHHETDTRYNGKLKIISDTSE